MQLVTTQQALDALDILDAYADHADHADNPHTHKAMQQRLKALAQAFDVPYDFYTQQADRNSQPPQNKTALGYLYPAPQKKPNA